MNVAARLETAAAIGDVLIGTETGRTVRDIVPLEPVPPLAVKGKEQPVRAMRVALSQELTPMSATAFVGREDDLSRLLAAFGDVVREGRAGLVTVVGSPGLGKAGSRENSSPCSRLAPSVIEARCTPSGRSSFGPIVDALRLLVDLDDSASADVVHRAVLARTAGLGVDADRVAATVAALLVGSPPGSAEQVFWSLRRFVEALAQERRS